ncbi:uncharacterized protein LOC126843770 isoform X1 [Adelges cooleyi]|uniref:uncharacterized protein LOC126843770 isoform X1 n=1 Tax=Adelges cooleyi TaxID=133065 RepID=UPI0021803FC6|nr:uncharacterized protein LOC126843770 isoform X1 [Adelges cooleyi]
MIFVNVMISFALVNVCIAEADRYTTEVFKANLHLKQAEAQLPAVIKDVVLGKYMTRDISLMLTSPDTEKEIDTKYDKLVYQIFLQDMITYTTDIDVITVLDEEMKGQLENFNLSDLGDARRKLTSETVKNLIRSVIRGELSEEFKAFVDVCRLIAVFRAIEEPTSVIEAADFCEGTRGRCIIEPLDNDSAFYYKQIGDEIWEIDNNDTKLHLLADQVKKN